MSRWRWLWIGTSAGLALILYGRGLGLPFYMDDLMAIPLVHKLSWGELWSGSYVLGTYRPLSYSIWKLFAAIWGFHPLPFKLLNLGLHIINGLLAGELARMWWAREASLARQRLAALVGAVFLIAFPWAYQAIPWVGCTFHPLISIYSIAMVLAYDRLRRGEGRWWAAAVSALVLLGPFTHELGYLLPPLLVLAEVRGRGTRDYPPAPRWIYLWGGGLALGVAAAYLYRQTIPHAMSVGDFGFSWLNLFQNGSYFLQALTHPTALISGALRHRAGVEGFAAVWLVGLPTLLAVVWAIRRAGWARWLTALMWAPVAASASLVFFEYSFLNRSSRYLVFASPGVALVWAGVLVHLMPRRRIVCVLLVVLIVPGMVPLAQGMTHLVMMGEVLDDIAAAGKAAPADSDEALLFVNLPDWMIQSPPPYALGNYANWIFFSGYFRPDQVIYITSLKDIKTHNVAFANLFPEVPYAFGVLSDENLPSLDWDQMAQAVRTAGSVYLAQYEPDRMYLLRAGSVTQEQTQGEPLAAFESGAGAVWLMDAEPVRAKGQPGVRLLWAIQEGFSPDLEVFVHLYDAEGALVSQADGPFLMGLYPMWISQAGQNIVDYRYFGRQPEIVYTIGIGLYDPKTGERAPVAGADGNPLPDGMLTVQGP